MVLPPEILDEVLGYVPPDEDGEPTLLACALVATWWTGPSQRRLFSSVEIHEDNYQRWMNAVVSPAPNTHLLGYVRSLWHSRGTSPETRYRIRDLARDSGGYLSALCNLHSLTLHNSGVECIGEEDFRTCFSVFRETLTHLSLEESSTSFNAFVALVDYFPNITSLELDWLVLEPDEGSVPPPLSRPLRGKICIQEIGVEHLEFFNRFAELDLEYEEMVIDSEFSHVYVEERFLESTLRISASTLKFLRMTAALPCE